MSLDKCQTEEQKKASLKDKRHSYLDSCHILHHFKMQQEKAVMLDPLPAGSEL